ncbi:AraC family transcriptional regulator [Niabella yanshanensis]|uniref:AraC family transcriptional regulator n=1 Tax=Niabella yanshanensis TaxID=577386 RepID=A0ABZ0W9F9_9BACT|nr:AraC family transcriptional regulator [Niabella yanshanensis]WQD38790.1 AraC family transcriptional regulator [Niabella yanshanensis]
MKKFFYLLLLTVCSIFSIKAAAQDPDAYNKLYTKVYLEISPKDMQLALQMADSLFAVSTTPLFKTKSLMLSASLYQQQQSLTKAAELAEEAYKIIGKTSDYNWMVRISGFLATQYRMLQLYGKSKIYCDRALAMVPRINNPEMVKSTMGLIYQELAYNAIAVKDYHASLQYIRESQKNFDHISQNKEYLTADNEQLLGLNYFHLADYKRALHHYQKSLNLMSNMPDNITKGLCYNGIAAVYIQKENLSRAKPYLDSAGKVAGDSRHLPLKNEIYKTSQQYYLKVKDLSGYEKVRQQQDSVRDEISSSRAKFLDSALIKMENKNLESQRIIKARNIPIALGAIFIIAGTSYFYFYRRRQKRRFSQFMADFEREGKTGGAGSSVPDFIPPLLQPELTTVAADDATNDLQNEVAKPLARKQANQQVMPEETQQRILAGLNLFEEQHLFTAASISLSFLSTHLNTNSKYLSYILRQYKQKDFTRYINDLRINYIIKSLKEDPEWRKYKISILAEKAGFSSHSKFTNIFKTYTGLSPSTFIQYLEGEKAANVNNM